jgi:alkylation response protein AidB-like acyl-CoA dehydrogenase
MTPPLELQAETPAGARLVRCAESLAKQLSLPVTQHERDGIYSQDNARLLKEAGYFVAPIPAQFGGLDVTSVHDILVASTRLARGDPSTTLGVNMHLLIVLNIVRRWRLACLHADERRAEAFGRSLERMVEEGVVLAAAISEPNQHLTQPAARATRNGAGWIVNGRKIFCTMSPAATHFVVSVTYQNFAGTSLYGYVEIPADALGITIHDDWDALGMRTSGSNSVSFRDVRVSEAAVRGGFPVGDTVGYIERNLANGLFHASASVGIAEAAHANVIARLSGHTNECRAPEQVLAAENAIDVSAMRATFARAAQLVEAFQTECIGADPSAGDWTTIFAEVQAAKTFVNQAAVRIVDRALTLSGGAGYMWSHPLARAYRDVRAGSFMQPLGFTRAHEFIARATLNMEPQLV